MDEITMNIDSEYFRAPDQGDSADQQFQSLLPSVATGRLLAVSRTNDNKEQKA